MKPNSLYAQLELITEPIDSQRSMSRDRAPSTDYSLGRAWARAKVHLRPLGSALLNYFCGSRDLRVTVRRDRQGNTQFVAYDPVSQQRHSFSSEHELRVWVDQRYYL
jgi:hypothetical protein